MSDKKTKILDNFHNAMRELSRANLMYHGGRLRTSVVTLAGTRDYIDKLIQEIKDE